MKKIVIVLSTVLLIVACSKNDDQPNEDTNDVFNRQAMLVNWADNIILPSYSAYIEEVATLKALSGNFAVNPSQQNLDNIRIAWRNAYQAFQEVAMFEIGPAEQVRFRDRMNTYPTNVAEIESLIAAGDYNFSLPSTNDAQGFPAIDYMLHGVGATDQEILDFYFSHPNASANRNYLFNLVDTLQVLSNTVVNEWANTFRDDFVANDGSTASASVDKLTNDFIFYFEKSLRAGKIGIPAGVFSNNTLPGNVEALYAEDFSKQLAMTALKATERFFKGQSYNGNQAGESYVTYLNYLNTIKNGADLSSLISAQFTAATSKMNTLDANFVQQIQNDNSKMLETYDALQQNVILLKVDMLQALSINVDYIDADGD